MISQTAPQQVLGHRAPVHAGHAWAQIPGQGHLTAQATHPLPSFDSSTELPPTTTAPRLARRHVRETLTVWNADDDTLDAAGLVVTELVTNAVLHATASWPIVLTLCCTCAFTDGSADNPTGARLILAVCDHDTRPPVSHESGPETCGGRGLAIIEAIAERWSWYRVAEGRQEQHSGKVVWCELPLLTPGPLDRRALSHRKH